MQSKNKKKTIINSKIKNSKGIGYYLPIIFILVIIPLITFGKIIELPIEEANFWKGGTTHVDFFYYYKYIAFIIGTIAALLAYGGLSLNNKLPLQKEKRYYISMLVYSLFVIISTVLSPNKHAAVEGFIEMYQGLFVLICYMLIMFIVLNYVTEEKDIKIFVYSIAVLTVAEGLLGVGQYLGFDLLKTSFGQWLITPEVLKGVELRFTFGKYTIYGTMYNTNFVGSFGVLILPITSALYIYSKDKTKSIIFYITAILAFATLIGSNSRAGYLGIIAVFIVGIIILRKIIKKFYKKTLILVISFIFVTVLFNIVSGGRTLNQFNRLNPVTEAKKIETIQINQTVRFEKIYAEDNTFIFKTNKESLILEVVDLNLIFRDDNNRALKVNDNNGILTFEDEKYKDYKFIRQFYDSDYINAIIYNRDLDLYIIDGTIKVISMNNKLTEPVEAQRVKFLDGRETFASNRGYIWSRTIPMLKDTLIVGYGPDNYPMVFPQEDYVGRFNVGNSGMLNTIIDKPHNMYLQTAVNTGFISLLALLAIWGIYLFDSFKIYIKGNMKTFTEYMGAASFLSITGYLVAGLFNDSVISVAPLFWIILGMGIGINRMIKDSERA